MATNKERDELHKTIWDVANDLRGAVRHQRCLLLVMCLCVCNAIFAQGVYSRTVKYDKFEDVISNVTEKTLIKKTDSCFVIETKGQQPEYFFYIDVETLAFHNESKDDVLNLVNNVYGYEDIYVYMKKEDILAVYLEIEKELSGLDSTQKQEQFEALLGKKMDSLIDSRPKATYRTLSKYQFVFEYDTDYFWIKYPDGSKTVYSKK